MLLTKTQLLAAQFASQDENRPACGVLRVDPAGVVWATNGKYLVKVLVIVPLVEEDFPIIMPMDSLPVSASILIPRALALTVARAIPKCSFPVLNHAQLRALPDGRAVLAVTNLTTPHLWYIEPQDITFPEVEGIMQQFRRKPLRERIGFSAICLKDVVSYACKTKAKGGTIALEFTAPDSAIRFSWETETEEEIDGRIMPVKLGDRK